MKRSWPTHASKPQRTLGLALEEADAMATHARRMRAARGLKPVAIGVLDPEVT